MFVHPKNYDVIVVGAGHAGVEAALASSRMGCQTLLITANLDTIGQMSCNPAIGGLAKGHLVREIDALGGEMGKATEMSGLHFRMLNRSKGASVWAPRAQCDKKEYQNRLKWTCEREGNLDIRQAQTTRLMVKDGRVFGVGTSLEVSYQAACIVVTTGTFLRGLIHIGSNQQQGGRAGETAAMNLSDSLREIGIELGRLKTGTPPRLLKRSIDFSNLEAQPGEEPVPHFTFWRNDLFHVELDRSETFRESGSHDYPPGSILSRLGGQMCCHITSTTEKTAEIIRANLHKSPMYSGAIKGIGPRYCPSIEDKIVRFAEKDRHQIFLEPEGIATDEIYVNGFSTCLPYKVQIELVRTIVGCEKAEIMRPAYTVEYDFAFPTQLRPTLESKACANLFLAGQINGTSGYEEAAAQGLIAGINAALRVKNCEPLVLGRDQAYIGVLIDDLVTKGTVEPYRMFTSRAEYRLLLRQDNADQRLSNIGFRIGLLSKRNHSTFCAKQEAIQSELQRLESTRFGTDTLAQILRRPNTSYRNLPGARTDLSEEIVQEIEILLRYEGYISRQTVEVSKSKAMEEKQIPTAFDYSVINGLRIEARQKLSKIQPQTIGQASRISGVTPADISVLLIWMKRAAASNPTASESSSIADLQNHEDH